MPVAKDDDDWDEVSATVHWRRSGADQCRTRDHDDVITLMHILSWDDGSGIGTAETLKDLQASEVVSSSISDSTML